jgi:hypothetical protein
LLEEVFHPLYELFHEEVTQLRIVT